MNRPGSDPVEAGEIAEGTGKALGSGLGNGRLKLLIQQILSQDQQGDAHQGEGLSSVGVTRELQGAGGLKMLGPGQSHAATVRRI
jgi:hypothetical protein